MTDSSSWPLLWAGALLAGGALGVLFFAGLWWTVRRGAASSTPARWFIGSAILRTAIVVAGFYAVGAGDAVRLGLCALGFVLARALVLRATRPTPAVPAAPQLSGGPPCA
ncbi:MAG: ATP synthase subunit I [Gammaproteobacteria bacterium]|nr:ATP synthase subunit I [Gammaproteobacteria bacterium]